MAQFYFRYASMNSGKSIDVLKTYHNYIEQGTTPLLFSSSKDDRFGKGVVASRIGIKEKAILFDDVTNIFDIVSHFITNGVSIDCILVDEGQFLKREQVLQLSEIVDDFNIPVIVYGLRTDFRGNLFEGSEALFCEADKIEELKTVCWFCNRKATRNMRIEDRVPVFEGEQIAVGENASVDEKERHSKKIGYLPTCRKCMRTMRSTGSLLPTKSNSQSKVDIENKIWETYNFYLETSHDN